MSWNQDMDQTPSLQDQVPEQTRISLDQAAPSVGEEENSSDQRPSPLKKKVQVESRRNQGPVARAAASHLSSSSGLRKAQSVQSLLTDAGKDETQEVSPDGQCGDSSLTPRTVGGRGIRWSLQMFNITWSLCPIGDSSPSQAASRPSRDTPPQLLLPPQRPTTLPSSPRRPPSLIPAIQRPSPASPRSPQQEPMAAPPRKLSSSTSSAPVPPRSYMSPTASSMAKMSRSASLGDGLHLPEPTEDTSATSSSPQVKEAPPPLVAVAPSSAAVAMPPHAAVVPVVASSLSSLGNPVAPPPRSLQARVAGSSRPLPDKPSLASFTPSASSSRPPPVSVSPLGLPRQDEESQAPAELEDDTGLESDAAPPPLHPYILSPVGRRSPSNLTGENCPCFFFSCFPPLCVVLRHRRTVSSSQRSSLCHLFTCWLLHELGGENSDVCRCW